MFILKLTGLRQTILDPSYDINDNKILIDKLTEIKGRMANRTS